MIKKRSRLISLLIFSVFAALHAGSMTILNSKCQISNGNIDDFQPDDWCKANVQLAKNAPALIIKNVKNAYVICSNSTFKVKPGETLSGWTSVSGAFYGGVGIYCYDDKGLIGAVMPRAIKENNPATKKIDFSIQVPELLNDRIPKSARFVIQFNSNSDCQVSKIVLQQPVIGIFKNVLDHNTTVKNGKINGYIIDDWCQKNISLPDNAEALSVRNLRDTIVVLSNDSFSIAPEDMLAGVLTLRGKGYVGIGLYVYDNIGFIGGFLPIGKNCNSGAKVPYEFSFSIPDKISGRIPTKARFVLQCGKDTSLDLFRIVLTRKPAAEKSVISGDSTAVIDIGNFYNISAIISGNEQSPLNGCGFSYYAHGIWNNESSKNKTARIISEKEGVFEAVSENADFRIYKKYTAVPSCGAIKINAVMEVMQPFFIGGGDPPGGIHFPAISISPEFSQYARIGANDKLEKYTEKDFPYCRFGVFEEDDIVIRSTPDGKKGVIFALDNRFYRQYGHSPYFNMFGLAWPNLAFSQLAKGQKINIEFYMLPFSGNLEEKLTQLQKNCLSQDKRERKSVVLQRSSFAAKPSDTARVLDENESFLLYSSGIEFVLPEQKVPSKKASAIIASAARGENEFIQLAVNPKSTLHKASLVVEDLKCGSNIIPKANISVHFLEPAEVFFGMTPRGLRGIIPDRMSDVSSRTLRAGINHSYILGVSVPSNIPGGIYEGYITFSCQEKSVRQKVNFELFDFQLPKISEFETAFLAWGGEGYLKKQNYKWNFDHKIIERDMLKMRISSAPDVIPVFDSNGVLSKDQFIKDLKKTAEQHVAIRIGGVFEWRSFAKIDRNSPSFEKKVRNFARQVGAAAKEANLGHRLWWLMVDETHWGELRLQEHIKWCKWVHEEAPNIRICSTQNHPENRLADVVDLVIGSISSTESLKNSILEKKQYWLYENGNYFSIGITGAETRMMPWKAYAGNYTGYHQWSVCSWTEGYYPGAFHGTGSFYYPPRKDASSQHAVRSLRLVAFADGMDDYDYLKMLDTIVNKCRANNNAVQLAIGEKLKKEVHSFVPNAKTINGNEEQMRGLRYKIGKYIESNKALL